MSNQKKDRKELNWFLQLITLGDRFSARDFFDRLKKGFVEFLIVFFGVLVSFSVEQQGEDFDDRGKNIDNLENLRNELVEMQEYTQEYIGENEWVSALFQNQYEKWDIDNDSVFLYYDEDMLDEHFPPLAFYTQRNPFNPPRVVYDAIKLDGTFRFLGTDIGRKMKENYDGVDLEYLMINSDKEEKTFIDEYNYRIAHQWVFDLGRIEVNDNNFWIKHREYIQRDRFMRYNLLKRLELWQEIRGQLEEYNGQLASNIKYLDSVINVKNDEWTLIWWWGEKPDWLRSSPKLKTEELPDQEPLAVQ